MKFNNITYPGNTFTRILFRDFGSSNQEVKDSIIPVNTSTEYKVRAVSLEETPYLSYLFRKLGKYENKVSVYIHGSWADGTNNHFSDIDDYIIINDDSVNEEQLRDIIKILNKIDSEFCRLDPLQHHGHWIVGRSELENYNNSFIPIFILKDAKNVIGDNDICAKINHETTKVGLRNNIIRTADNIESFSAEMFNKSINAYKLKALIGSIALMPAMIFQLEGLEVDKRTAISRSNEIFNEENNQLTLWATDCRNNWSVIVNSFRFKVFSMFPHLFRNPHLWRKVSNKFSPKVQGRQLNLLSKKKYDNQILEEYLKEVRSYVK